MANAPTKAQRAKWERIRELGCIVELENEFRRCESMAEIHHLYVSAGGRRNHDFVIPLCFHHHRGQIGYHTLRRKMFESIYGTESELYQKTLELLGDICPQEKQTFT